VWLDREWGTSALSPGLTGWDWFGLELDDGRDLMFYRLRREDGTTGEFSGGTLADGTGTVERLTAEDVEIEPIESWASPVTGISYPVAWTMRIPAAGLELRITPRLRDQEIDLSVRYWEGAVEVSGRAGQAPIGGRGYLELAGY
jgi:predicted secreted hydrolase